MNALYVTVSIPLLLVLAGFNHAHGLTTFGKTNTNNGPPPQKPAAQPQSCTSQEDCNIFKGATCIKKFCLCGNNENPANGKCTAPKRGANHICQKEEDCVENANCVAPPANKSNTLLRPNDKICVCNEGFYEQPTGTCGGESNFVVLPGLVLIITSLSRTLY